MSFSFYQPSTMPSELAALIAEQWNEVHTSPFGNSLYDTPGKTWRHTPEGSLRVSDHWNFRNKKHKPHYPHKVHCPTDRPPIQDGWTLARWDNGIYVILAEWPRRQPRAKKQVFLNRALNEANDKLMISLDEVA